MSVTQAKADALISLVKEAARRDVFTWEHNTQQEELVLAVEDRNIGFLLTCKRNPFEIKAQLRTKDRHMPLVRLDNSVQHVNPDGNILRGPHLHWFKEGYGLAWAEPATWYQGDKPMVTILHFLELVQTKFPNGIQEALL